MRQSERVRQIVHKQSAGAARGILWEGASPMGCVPIVAIATPTTNRKTGPMVQIWILRQDISPTDAVHLGSDTAICGHCPMRGAGFQKRSCYVQVPQAPESVWRAYRAGSYSQISPNALTGRMVRWGAYGDPAMLPEELVRQVNAVALGWTGYTHQWAQPWAQWAKGVLMASVETEAMERKLWEKGWGTFRAGRPDGSDVGKATVCANERTGEQCITCRACDGRRARIYIPAHGAGQSHVPAERLARKKESA